MRRWPGIPLWLFVTLTYSPFRAQEPTTTRNPPSDSFAKIWFSVIDKDGKEFAPLMKEDVRVTVNGAQQEIAGLERRAAVPVSLSFLIDLSGSQQDFVPESKTAALSFFESAWKQGQVTASVATFTNSVSVRQVLTPDLKAVQSAISDVKFSLTPKCASGGTGTTLQLPGTSSSRCSTALWDALWLTSEQIVQSPAAPEMRAIILISDGQDNSSKTKKSEAIERAIRDKVIIYAIGIGSQRINAIGFLDGYTQLRNVSEQTGGHAFFPKTPEELRKSISEISNELRSQYSVSYMPVPNKLPDAHAKKRIEIINPNLKKEKLTVVYRPEPRLETK